MLDLGNIDATRTTLLVLSGLIAWGTLLGATGRITVFRDAGDLLVTFALLAGWGATGFLVATFAGTVSPSTSSLFRYAWGAALIAILCVIIARSNAANDNFGWGLLAAITKLPYSILVPLLVLHAAAPTGRTAARRASARASALFFLAIFTPLVFALVQDKTDFNRVLRFGRRR